MMAATSRVRVDMKSMTVMLSTNAERNPASSGKRMKSFKRIQLHPPRAVQPQPAEESREAHGLDDEPSSRR